MNDFAEYLEYVSVIGHEPCKYEWLYSLPSPVRLLIHFVGTLYHEPGIIILLASILCTVQVVAGTVFIINFIKILRERISD